MIRGRIKLKNNVLHRLSDLIQAVKQRFELRALYILFLLCGFKNRSKHESSIT
jgi:hypothetical protein